MNAPSHVALRLTTLAFAALLGLQCVWLLLTEFYRPNLIRLPTDAQAAAAARSQRSHATWVARIAGIRGNLWAESAFTYADLLWNSPSVDPDSAKSLEQARALLYRALDHAPHQAGAWLLLAGLASHYHWQNLDSAEALKMSYYTGQSEEALMPLRLRMAARLDAISDTSLQILVRRDLRLLLAQQQKSAVKEAYEDASPGGRRFIEAAVGEIDPSSLGSLRASAQVP